MKLLGLINIGFDITSTDQIFCIRQILEKKCEHKLTVLQLFIDFRKAYDSVRREVLWNILIEVGVPMKLVSFSIQNGLKQGDALSPLFFNFALEYAVMKVRKN
jgi:hypothetical protein